MVFKNYGEVFWRYYFMAIDKSVFDLRRKIQFVKQEKMHDFVAHPSVFLSLHSQVGREFWKKLFYTQRSAELFGRRRIWTFEE